MGCGVSRLYAPRLGVDRTLRIRPRSYFEPFYLSDRSYRPEQSWVAKQDSRLLAYLRVFDREVRAGGAALSVASVERSSPSRTL